MRDLPPRSEVCEMLTMIVEARNEREWRHQAACKGMNPDLFFAQRNDYQSVKQAKAICATCPVSTQCFQEGRKEYAGVWGGLSATQRRNQGVPRKSFEKLYKEWIIDTEPSDDVAAYDLGISPQSIKRSRYARNTQPKATT
jgi:WhiB family redox-sensing transcriptional regulator